MNDRFSYNYLNEKNNIKIISCSSSHKSHPIENIIKDDIKLIWLSEKELPQYIIIDISNMRKKPKNNKFDFFGIYLWHSYKNNPHEIELYFSNDNKKYTLVGIYELEFKTGIQFFKIDNNIFLNSKINFLKINITKTYGANKPYINQIFLLDCYDKYFSDYIKENSSAIDNNNDIEITKYNTFYKLKKQINESYIQEVNKRKKKFNNILNSDKILRKFKTNQLNKNKLINNNKINSLSQNNSFSKYKNKEIRKRNKKVNINNNYSTPTNSNLKSSNSTNFTSLRVKNHLEKKTKISLREILNHQLNDMTNCINSFEKNYISNKKYIIPSPEIRKYPISYYDWNMNRFNNNNNNLNFKVDNLEKSIDIIQNDLNNIKRVIYSINDKKYNNKNYSQKNFYNFEQFNYDYYNNNNENININQNFLDNNQGNIIKRNNYKTSNNSYYNFDNKINEKIYDLTDNIEHQIIKNMIEPSIRQFKQKMKRSFTEMKNRIERFKNHKQFKENTNSSSNYSNNFNHENSSETSKYTNQKFTNSNLSYSNYSELEKKYKKIKKISNLLYSKLKEKEKLINKKIKTLKK